VVVDAMAPVTASVASASAAIFDLIDMENSIRFKASRSGPHADWTKRLRIRFDAA
jgi:hypothetical protein